MDRRQTGSLSCYAALKDVIEANNKAQVISIQASSELTNLKKVLSDLGYRLQPVQKYWRTEEKMNKTIVGLKELIGAYRRR